MRFNPFMDMHSIRRRNLRALIDQRSDGNVAQFGRDTGFDEARLSQLLSEKYRGGKNFGEKAARTVESVAALPALSLDCLDATEFEELYVKLTAVSGRKPQFDKNVLPAAVGKRAIPVISAIQAGALKEINDPYAAGDGFAVEYTDDNMSKWAFALEIEGESMLPEFRPGDRVLIDPELAPNPGDFVVAKNGKQEATFKKYRPRGVDADGNTIFELVPLNDDYAIMRSDTETLQIIGVMLEHRKKYRRSR